MPIWRSPALEELLGGTLDGSGLTETAILRLVAGETRESEVLEFKRDPYPGRRRALRGAGPPNRGLPRT